MAYFLKDCFAVVTSFTLDSLATIIRERTAASAEISYTRSLLQAGMGRMTKKFGEEAVEAVIAAMQHDLASTNEDKITGRTALISESADVLYHLLVLLQGAGICVQDVMEELERRTMRSGHAEKASRT